MTNLVLKSVRVVDPAAGRDETADIIIRDGVIRGDGATLDGLTVVNAAGLLAAPGFWDVHVHFRDPGNALAETRQSGAAAAAAGGFTHVVTMPNTDPAGDSAEWLRTQIEDSLPVKILPAACITRGRQGREIADLENLAAAGAAVFTDDGATVADEALMREAMIRAAKLDKPVMDHAVLPDIAKNGIVRDCALARQLGLPLFPPEAEIAAVFRDIRLCRETGCAVHIQHISCAAAVEAIRSARAAGLPVSGEASPHHLALAVEDIPGDDGNYRMNPPLGSRTDVRAIRDGLLDNTLTLFATDHAPHTAETKNRGFKKAAFGVIGLETAIGVTWRVMVAEEGMSVPDWVARWTIGPAALLGLPAPTLAPGTLADLTLIDARKPWQVNPGAFRSLSRNTPFAGWMLPARAVLTVCGGHSY